jgi:hypothetical protein
MAIPMLVTATMVVCAESILVGSTGTLEIKDSILLSTTTAGGGNRRLLQSTCKGAMVSLHACNQRVSIFLMLVCARTDGSLAGGWASACIHRLTSVPYNEGS